MSEDFVRSVLKDHLDATMPRSRDPWPSIQRRVRVGGSDRLFGWGINLRSVGVALAGALLLVLGLAAGWLRAGQGGEQARVLSAEQIWAETEQASQRLSSDSVRTAHMMTRYRFKYEGMSASGGGTSETWYQAPGKMLEKNIYWGDDQVKHQGSVLQKGTTTYSAEPLSSLLQISERDTPVGFGRLSLAQLTQDYSDMGRIKDAFSMRIVGTEQIVGRPAYVLERTIRPEVLKGWRATPVSHKAWLWVDQELYIVLKAFYWNKAGDLVEERSVDYLELNKPLDAALFELEVPTGYLMADMRPASMTEIEQGWREAYRKMNVTLYQTTDVLRYGPDLRRPYYDAPTGVVSQALVRRPGNFEVVRALIVQGPPSAIDVSRLGSSTAVTVGKQRGRLYGTDKNRLVFELGGTRIMIYSPETYYGMADELVRFAETLAPVQKK